jgi:hypothetical protein
MGRSSLNIMTVIKSRIGLGYKHSIHEGGVSTDPTLHTHGRHTSIWEDNIRMDHEHILRVNCILMATDTTTGGILYIR